MERIPARLSSLRTALGPARPRGLKLAPYAALPILGLIEVALAIRYFS